MQELYFKLARRVRGLIFEQPDAEIAEFIVRSLARGMPGCLRSAVHGSALWVLRGYNRKHVVLIFILRNRSLLKISKRLIFSYCDQILRLTTIDEIRFMYDAHIWSMTYDNGQGQWQVDYMRQEEEV